jgi:hypothetical protein
VRVKNVSGSAPVAADLERAEVLVPRPVGRDGFSALPVIKLEEIGDADFALRLPVA